ncbi:carbonic anhydrase 12-like [Amphibalanus amphitrite]|uniref:carbonic anhydrase 12-like n=1 Tax=Amphibalanus amphitrite TaxID=1232801 RepID=UPI001C9074D9|nr:carbonic anhydrase 12-like [Amphibalanus amphitrite]
MAAALSVVLLVLLRSSWSSGCEPVGPEGHGWSYHDLHAWNSVEGSQCGQISKQQSPIDLTRGRCGASDAQPPHVALNRNWWPVVVSNDGRTLKIDFDCFGAVDGLASPMMLFFPGAQSDLQVSKEDLRYELAEVHFHWGGKGRKGSEHAIEGQRFDAEAHFKFKHVTYSLTSYYQVRLTEGALYAVGVPLIAGAGERFNLVSDTGFPTFGLEDTMSQVRRYNTGFNMTINVAELKTLFDRVLQNVYKYTGSLTTPPCTLKLPWLVSAEPTYIKPEFLAELRKLRDEKGSVIKHNVRPLQKKTLGVRGAALLVLLIARCQGCGLAPPEGLPWNYRDFQHWESLDGSFCGEQEEQQSPIDLYGEECDEDESYQPRVKQNSKTWDVTVTNNGRTLKLMFDCDNQVASNEAHGPLTLYSDVGMEHEGLDYDLAELHFHWGEDDQHGSEHALKGNKFPAEAHLKFKHRSHAGVAFHVAKLTEAKPAKVKSSLLDELRKLKDETGQQIKRNYRDLQQHTDELELCRHDD